MQYLNIIICSEQAIIGYRIHELNNLSNTNDSQNCYLQVSGEFFLSPGTAVFAEYHATEMDILNDNFQCAKNYIDNMPTGSLEFIDSYESCCKY